MWYGMEAQCSLVWKSNVVLNGGVEQLFGMVWRNPWARQTGQQDEVLARSFKEDSQSLADPV